MNLIPQAKELAFSEIRRAFGTTNVVYRRDGDIVLCYDASCPTAQCLIHLRSASMFSFTRMDGTSININIVPKPGREDGKDDHKETED